MLIKELTEYCKINENIEINEKYIIETLILSLGTLKLNFTFNI